MPLVEELLPATKVWFDDSLDVPIWLPKAYPVNIDYSDAWLSAIGDLFGIGWMQPTDQPVIGRIDQNLYLGELLPQLFGPFNWTTLIADNVGLTDAGMPIVERALVAVIQNRVGLTDFVDRTMDFLREILETAGLTDSLSTIGDFNRSVSDGVGLTDVPFTARDIVLAALANNVGLADAGMPSVIRGIAYLFANNVGLTDAVIKTGTFYKSFSDNVGVTDSLIKQANYVRMLAESVGTTDVIAAYFAAISHYLYARAINWVLQARKNESS